jgi:hypothetical protein
MFVNAMFVYYFLWKRSCLFSLAIFLHIHNKQLIIHCYTEYFLTYVTRAKNALCVIALSVLPPFGSTLQPRQFRLTLLIDCWFFGGFVKTIVKRHHVRPIIIQSLKLGPERTGLREHAPNDYQNLLSLLKTKICNNSRFTPDQTIKWIK